jgi:2-iminobutanoate/2-iminopropanoate deaminase
MSRHSVHHDRTRRSGVERRAVHTSGAPEAIGPYSQAIVSDGYVFCSGQVPLDPSTGELIEGSIADQTRRCMVSLEAVLSAAGTDVGSIVKTTIYLVDMNDFVEVNEAYGEFFTNEPPARATVEVAGLPKGARVEIECVARV